MLGFIRIISVKLYKLWLFARCIMYLKIFIVFNSDFNKNMSVIIHSLLKLAFFSFQKNVMSHLCLDYTMQLSAAHPLCLGAIHLAMPRSTSEGVRQLSIHLSTNVLCKNMLYLHSIFKVYFIVQQLVAWQPKSFLPLLLTVIDTLPVSLFCSHYFGMISIKLGWK